MARKCQFKFYSHSEKECVYSPTINSDFCFWHDAEIQKDGDVVPVKLQGALKETGGDFEGFLLRKANLANMNLRDVDLRDTDLREANLDGADCRGIDFRGSKLNRVSAAGTNFEGANFMAANLSDGNFVNANLRNVNLRIVNFGHANLSGADFTGSDIRNTDLAQTEQNEQTNFFDVVGVTSKIVQGTDAEQAPPSAPSPAGIPGDASIFGNESEGTQTPATSSVAPPSGGIPPVDYSPAAGVEPPVPYEGQGYETDVVKPFSDDYSDEYSDAQGQFGESPLTPMGQQSGAIGRDLADDSIFGPREDDETSYSIEVGSLTKKHTLPVGAFGKKLLVFIIILVIGTAIGVFIDYKYLDLKKDDKESLKGTAELAVQIKSLKSKLGRKDSTISSKEEEITILNGSIVKLEGDLRKFKRSVITTTHTSDEVKDLQNEREKLANRLKELKTKSNEVVSKWKELEGQNLKLIVKISELSENDEQIKQANKKLLMEKTQLSTRLSESEEILKEFKNRVLMAEEKNKILAKRVTVTQNDDFIMENPDSHLIEWGIYVVAVPEDQSHIIGLKFSKPQEEGGFYKYDIFLAGRGKLSKPSFKIILIGPQGNELKQFNVSPNLLLKKGQIKFASSGWVLKGGPPKYYKIVFPEK